MKHFPRFLLLALCGMVLLVSSCKPDGPHGTDESDTPQQTQSDVTVMIYGAGGGSLNRHEPSLWSKSGFSEELDDPDAE